MTACSHTAAVTDPGLTQRETNSRTHVTHCGKLPPKYRMGAYMSKPEASGFFHHLCNCMCINSLNAQTKPGCEEIVLTYLFT